MRSVRWLEAIWKSGSRPDGTWILLTGSSMEPTYTPGDWLLVKPLTGAPAPNPGEVVIARRGNRLVMHRLVSVRDGMAFTRGDACRRPDSPVPVGALLGRVVSARRRAAHVRTYHRLKRFHRIIADFMRRGR